jgi:hypothetical protein
LERNSEQTAQMGVGFVVGFPFSVGDPGCIRGCARLAEVAVCIDLRLGEITWSVAAEIGPECHVSGLDVAWNCFVGHRDAHILFLVAPSLVRRQRGQGYSFKSLALALDDRSERGDLDFASGSDEFDWDRAPGSVDGIIEGAITR